MVKGLDIFREYFKDYTNQYVLIGGTACTVSFEQQIGCRTQEPGHKRR